MPTTRRHVLRTLAAAAGASALPESALAGLAPRPLPLACNQYPWHTFYQREGRNWAANPDASLAELAASGLKGYEPIFTSAAEVKTLLPLLAKHGLAMHSLYVNSTLHRADEAEKSLESVLAIAEAARPAGTRIIVTNPSPIRWGGPENKSDAELTEQARNLDRLGAELKKHGLTLAYHTHDVELREAAREFHHMLLATDPARVALCLDAHWVYRGAGNSQVALFDVVKLYGRRVVEIHLRQSIDGVWGETFGEGDIDYARLATDLQRQGVRPHLVLEQCIEKASPRTLNGVEAHRQDLAYASRLFREWLEG